MILPVCLSREASEPSPHCPVVAGQNVEDVEADPLYQRLRIVQEIDHGIPAGFLPDPVGSAPVSPAISTQILIERAGDRYQWPGAAAHAARENPGAR